MSHGHSVFAFPQHAQHVEPIVLRVQLSKRRGVKDSFNVVDAASSAVVFHVQGEVPRSPNQMGGVLALHLVLRAGSNKSHPITRHPRWCRTTALRPHAEEGQITPGLHRN
jgi:hypothetical protein